jgi:hypothetical protein
VGVGALSIKSVRNSRNSVSFSQNSEVFYVTEVQQVELSLFIMEPTIMEEEGEGSIYDDILSPPRQGNFSTNVTKPQHEETNANIENTGQSDESKSAPAVGTIPITPQRGFNGYKYTTPTRTGKSLDDLFQKGAQVKYYRIIYKGIVALLSKPEAGAKKSGAYVSYGEIVASTHEIDITFIEASPKSTNANQNEKSEEDVVSPKSAASISTATSNAKSTVSSSLPLAPSASFRQTKNPQEQREFQQHQLQAQPVRRIIQIDEVLTGGFAIDATTTATSHTHITPRRSNSKNVSFAPPNTIFPSATPPSTPWKSIKKEKGILASKMKHHGYLFQSRKGMAIAESIPAPPLLCQAGTFYYRVVSKSPLPILAGPCADAPKTRAMVLSGTVHEISLRMGSLDPLPGLSRGSSGLEDGIVYLRLAHRRGWIADRRFVTSLLQNERNVGSRHQQYGRGFSDHDFTRSDEFVVSVELEMKELSDFVDVTTFGIQDDMSLGGTSISSNSFSTPSSIIRTRRRPARRRGVNDSRSGMVVQPKSKKDLQTGEDVLTPTSDVSISLDPSALKAPTTSQNTNSDSVNNEVVQSMERTNIPNQTMSNSMRKPDIYLVRVTAVTGLKILDAPHFQVNNLIRGQGTGPMQGVKKRRDQLTRTMPNKTNPSSITHTMNHRNDDLSRKPGITSSWIFDASGKHRILPKGALFEASKRIENAGNYAPGSGLVKLADNTGWAIIPNQNELREQYQLHKANAGMGITESEALRAYEEVGNSVSSIGKRSSHNDENVLWVRIVQQNGVLVSCSPGSGKLDLQTSSHESQALDQSHLNAQKDVDSASTVSSAFFDAFRSSKKPEAARLDSLAVNSNNRVAKLQAVKNSTGTIIPCGSCVKVRPWIPPSSQPENQSFVRLCGGQGWIPRIIHGVQYSVDIKEPDVRHGSFWFRVQPKNGVQVRIGPSSRSSAIKSNNEYFQFECGEYLRASEVLTIHGHADINNVEDVDHPYESFAKLYRNKGGAHLDESYFGSLISLTSPGEWVHVHCNGRLHLEECVNPPCIDRHPDGWRFEVVAESGVQIRKGPSFTAPESSGLLQHFAIVLINEKVTDSGDALTWLRLKDGRGWIHNLSKSGNDIVKYCAIKRKDQRDGSINKLISRLGLR